MLCRGLAPRQVSRRWAMPAAGEPAGDLARLGGGFGPQAVIDGERRDGAAAAPRPAGGEQRQRQAVGAARDADGERRPALERTEPRHEIVEFARRDRPWPIGGDAPGRRSAHRQPNRSRAALAPLWILAGASGNFRLSSAKAVHASVRLLSRPSDMPSFNRLSGPLALSGYF